MAKKTPLTVSTGFASQTQLNAEFADIADHLNTKVHYRDNPVGEPNSMQNELDMNSNRLTNLPIPSANTDAATKVYVDTNFVQPTITADAVYPTVALLKLGSLANGLLVVTKGYYAGGDGGGANYYIKSSGDYGGTPDEYGDHTLADGNIAVLQAEGAVNVKQFGAVGDGTTPDTLAIQAAIDWMQPVESRGLFFPPLDFKVTATITIASAEWYHDISAYGARISSTITSGAALQVGNGTTGFEYSFIRGLTIVAPNADSVMLISGADVQSSTFKDMVLVGYTPTPTQVGSCLLLMGNRTYYNNFENITMRGAVATLSINYNHATSARNTESNTANANRFINCQFNRYQTYGIYLYGSVGNTFFNYEFNAAVGGSATDDVYITEDATSSKKSRANYFQGRHESGATNEFTIGAGCVLNVLMPMLGATIVFGDSATKEDNIIIFGGGTQKIQTPVLQVKDISALGTVLNFVTPSGYRVSLTDAGLSPLTVDDNRIDLGKSTGRYKDLYYAGYVKHTVENNIEPYNGGGQANAYQLTAYFSEVDRPTNAGDSVKLPAEEGARLTIFNNDGSLAIDVFPHVNGNLDGGSTNAAVSLAVGARITYFLRDTNNWVSI